MKTVARVTVLFAMVVGVLLGTSSVAQAAYYNEYSDIASTPDSNGCTAAQGFAAGATYLYVVKTKGDDSRAVIYRVNKSTGKRELMTNGTDKRAYNTWLGHANDMTISDIDGRHHLFVVTMKSSGAQLVKLRYDGTTYYKVGSYAVRLGGVTKTVSGISRVSVSSTTLKFFFKSGAAVYNGSIPLRANTGTVNLSKAFDLKVAGALVNGKTVSDLTTFTNQGFFYDAATKLVYYPLTKDNRSIVLVYRGVTAATRGTLTSTSTLSFRITSSVYSKFEIESVGTSGGRLYFNTNRSSSSGPRDAVHVFKGYSS
jgi:hypothetical protein